MHVAVSYHVHASPLKLPISAVTASTETAVSAILPLSCMQLEMATSCVALVSLLVLQLQLCWAASCKLKQRP